MGAGKVLQRRQMENVQVMINHKEKTLCVILNLTQKCIDEGR